MKFDAWSVAYRFMNQLWEILCIARQWFEHLRRHIPYPFTHTKTNANGKSIISACTDRS
jgi:hypothetical protein